ncbi:MAG: hypothetical protein COV60_03005 [Candidatus Magasanikbacteria bacterium CG11_big_fil_rev_8_21_14_0_20_43_7]|uniref:Phosphoribulokinase/uridine kinase domain-containing protein n=1 Tax=Candidatus Magasanikbacteria bacterium CG11_big_fil_rev_8_21_14_0_20_43_7 TaxID=1974654 RepID=A0A2H0N4A1_9BACT|nr:MAG: hypothetical protein COV60_03005 [Candidatus Magasanikbacteria bacterium CG11_big_fil_rev_8_21_14_0_20_43_7]
MKPTFIGIAGGTGAGKSTLCTSLQVKYPDTIGLIQLDDYFRPSSDVPTLGTHENWDHPDALYLDKLKKDLKMLSNGKSVMIHTKNERLNPEYKKTEKRIPVEFHPKPVMLIEGYLVLFDTDIRDTLKTSIWLDADHDTRWKRRVHFKYPEYETDVLLPMHKKFVEPTKQYAEHVIDVTGLSKEQVQKKVESMLSKFI